MKYEVWNKHPNGLTHREKFRGDDIVIKANDFVLMDYEDAVQFKGQYYRYALDGMGQQDPVTYKCIHLVPHKGTSEKAPEAPKEFVCNMDGKKFLSQAELDKYIEANFKEVIFKDEYLEKDAKIMEAIKGT